MLVRQIGAPQVLQPRQGRTALAAGSLGTAPRRRQTAATCEPGTPLLLGFLGTTLASVRELILPNLASNGERNQTALHCFTLVPRNENFCRLSSSPSPQFPPRYFSCKMNRNMLFFNKRIENPCSELWL